MENDNVKNKKNIKSNKSNKNSKNKKEIKTLRDDDREITLISTGNIDGKALKEKIDNYVVPKLEIPSDIGKNDKGKLASKIMEKEDDEKIENNEENEEKNKIKEKEKIVEKIEKDEEYFIGTAEDDYKDFYDTDTDKDEVKKENEEDKEKTELIEKNIEDMKEKNEEYNDINIKRINSKKMIILLAELIVVFFVVLLLIKGIEKINSRNVKVAKVVTNDVKIDDYSEAPLTNYGIYKTIPRVRGVYLSEYTMASSSNVDKWINICKQKEINAVVINVKNDDGRISFELDYDLAHQIGADEFRTIKDPAELTLKLKQAGIFPIARIVAFKDPYLAKHRPDLAIKDHSGNVLRIKSGNNWEAWVNPYNKELWDYIVNVSKCAADMGFKEIQYDYIRFATGPQLKEANFGFDSNTKTFRDIVLEFSRYAKEELDEYGVYLSCDVFGTIITSDVDAKIVGQNYKEMARIYDFICPMIYPSHYANGSLGIQYPDLDPYNLVLNAMNESNKILDEIPKGEHRAIVRAWLQDFTAPWVKPHQTYGAAQLRQQKSAIYNSNNTEWLLWNAGNKYSIDGLD